MRIDRCTDTNAHRLHPLACYHAPTDARRFTMRSRRETVAPRLELFALVLEMFAPPPWASTVVAQVSQSRLDTYSSGHDRTRNGRETSRHGPEWCLHA